MTVLVCGGRYYANRALVFSTLDDLKPIRIIEGQAMGADRFAYEWAQEHDVACITCAPDWERFGHAAGHRRNAHMLTYRPDLVVAFPGGRGTADMVRQAKAAGVRVMEVPDEAAKKARNNG
jgi:hypothetical protein